MFSKIYVPCCGLRMIMVDKITRWLSYLVKMKFKMNIECIAVLRNLRIRMIITVKERDRIYKSLKGQK